MPEKLPERQTPSATREVLGYLHVGSELAILTGLGAYGGMKLDEWWNSAPWCVLGGAAMGFALGFYQLVRMAKRADRR